MMVITTHVLTPPFKQMGPIYVLTCGPLRKFCYELSCDIILAPGLNPPVLFRNSPDIKALVHTLFHIPLSVKQNPPGMNYNVKGILVVSPVSQHRTSHFTLHLSRQTLMPLADDASWISTLTLPSDTRFLVTLPTIKTTQNIKTLF